MTQRHEDTETRGQRDMRTQRLEDTETRGQRD